MWLMLNDVFREATARNGISTDTSCNSKPDQRVVTITVKGGGISEANGTYVACVKHFKSDPYYFMKGKWKNKEKNFVLIQMPRKWRITVEGLECATFYTVPIASGNKALPPKDGWNVESNGKYPAPNLDYLSV